MFKDDAEVPRGSVETGGSLVVKTLQKAGVDRIFGLQGAHVDPIYQAAIDHDLSIIDARLESGVGHAAEGYARAGRRLGVALVTAGGGFTNVLTSITNAFLGRTPVVYLAGASGLNDTETNALQSGLDQAAMAAPVTKWYCRVTRADQIPRLLAQAIRIATAAPRGPVVLELPYDVLAESVQDGAAIPDMGHEVLASTVSGDAIEHALDLLANAHRPVVIVGSEARWGNVDEKLRSFVERIATPVFSDYDGLALLSGLTDLSCGLMQGLYGFRAKGLAPDAVLMLGVRFGLHSGGGSGVYIPHEARIVQIDPDARELGRLQAVELPIVADVAGAIVSLAEHAEAREWPDRSDWLRQCHEIVQERLAAVAANAKEDMPLAPYHAVAEIAQAVDPDAVVVIDGALSGLWMSEVISPTKPHDFLYHSYLASMGTGMGMAFGAKAASPDKRVILVTGDGALGYGITEFDSMSRNALPVVVVVLNNASWGATLHFQQMTAGQNRVLGNYLEDSDYHRVAEVFGGVGYRAVDRESLSAALREALASGKPACINVTIDQDDMPPGERILYGKPPY